MLCKCKYFLVVDGVRVCVQCGKPAHSEIEDKMVEQHEDKQIFPPESKRIIKKRGEVKRRLKHG